MRYVQGALVVLGNMNPAIYSPGWLRRYRIADEAEIAVAENENKGALFVAGGLGLAQIPCKNFVLTCDGERLTLRVAGEAHFELLKEVLVRVFSVLGQTPVKAIGINFSATHACPPPEGGHEALRRLFAAKPERMDSLFSAGWDVSARVTSRDSWPKFQVSFGAVPEGVRMDSNFHYEGDQLSSGIQVPDLVRERFGPDRQAFERFVAELFAA